MKIAMYIMFFLLCTCSVVAGKKKEKKPVEITHMECYSIGWNVNSHYRFRSTDITNRPPNLYDKISISNYVYLRDLQGHISRLEIAPRADSVYIDARIVCLLYKSDKTVDTLSFGSYDYCEYNGKCYYLTWQLFSHILNKVPHEQYEQVNWYMQDDPQIKARLEARDK